MEYHDIDYEDLDALTDAMFGMEMTPGTVQGNIANRTRQRPYTKYDFYPRMNVKEHDGSFDVYVELPGMSKQDIHVDTDSHNRLTVRGRKPFWGSEENPLLYHERSHGEFHRRVTLPKQYKNIQANYQDDGILHVHVDGVPMSQQESSNLEVTVQ